MTDTISNSPTDAVTAAGTGVRDGPPARAVCWAENIDDPRSTVRYLDAVAGHRRYAPAGDRWRPVVIRPTPGGGDRTGVALDVLTALMKNPEITRVEQLRTDEAWATARAWLTAERITDIVIDRAHELPVDRLVELANLGEQIPALVWFIWSGGNPDPAMDAMTAAGFAVMPMHVDAMRTSLPTPHGNTWPPTPTPWPDVPLPAADFTTFRAACRRQLGRAAFGRVDECYRDAADRTDRWLAQQNPGSRLPLPPTLVKIGADLVGWLRDEQLGPAPDPQTALITLRGTQAALFCAAILLRWTPDALGPDPAARLPGNLTGIEIASLAASGRTDHAAATALSLHLNHSPSHVTCYSVGDVTHHGDALLAHLHDEDPYADPATGRVLDRRGGTREVACESIVLLPEPAWPILRAHVAYRRHHGAADADPLFTAATTSTQPVGAQAIRNAARRTCQRINRNPPWLHPDPCRYGADVGLTERIQGWLGERGLALFQLDGGLAVRSPRWARYP